MPVGPFNEMSLWCSGNLCMRATGEEEKDFRLSDMFSQDLVKQAG